MCLVAIVAIAQEKANIIVSYNFRSLNLMNGNVDLNNQYILSANSNYSKFYSPITQYIDSLNCTSEGKAKLNQMTEDAILKGEYDKIPAKDGSFYVVKTLSSIILYDVIGTEKYKTEDIKIKEKWEISDSVKNVLGYECILATCEYHGRIWNAWFSPEIPIQEGPWKLYGLPGLILEALDDQKQYHFTATGIQQANVIITPIPMADEYEKINRQDFWKTKRSFLENLTGRLKAQLGENVEIITENGDAPSTFCFNESIDFIETDYNNISHK